jgi:hypothetical protein
VAEEEIVMHKIAIALSLVLSLVALDVGVARGDAHGTDRPYADTGSAVLSIDLNNLTVALAGTRHATHLGLSTWTTSNIVIDLSNLPLIGVTYDDTIVAANGDELYTTAVATIDASTLGVSPLAFSAEETITGGTGRFEGASGSISSAGLVDLDLSTFSGALTFTSAGTISY